ncbi:hypothetical protein HQ590_13665, partial [bacterium]|nr:hypothetical protein [bacterium]
LLVPVVVWFAGQRQFGQAARAAVAALVAGLALTGWLLMTYGITPVHQLVLLQMITGQRVSALYKLRQVVVPGLNVLLVLGAGGLILGVRRHPRGLGLLAAVLALPVVSFVVFKGTIWPHNLIDLLLPFALGTVFAVQEIIAMARAARLRAVPVAVLAVPAAVFIALGALRIDVHTRVWGYLPRGEISRAAEFLRAHVSPDQAIQAPHYLAAEAGRFVLVDYPELAGPYIWMVHTLDREGFRGLRRYKEFGPWMQMNRKLYPLWRPIVEVAVRERRVGAIVFDRIYPEWSHDLALDLALEREAGWLTQAGYRPAYHSGPYEIWLPTAGGNHR